MQKNPQIEINKTGEEMINNPNLTEAFTRGHRLGELDKASGTTNHEPIHGSWEGKSMQQHIADLTSEHDTDEFFHQMCDWFCTGYFEGNKEPRDNP